MKEFLQQIGSYNLFNYLLPGTIFCGFISKITPYNIESDNVVITAFMFYFIGLVISRIGSICVEPLLRKMKIVQFKPYSDYTEAAKSDKKLNVLSEQNNTYRTLLTSFILVIVVKSFDLLEQQFAFIAQIRVWLLIVTLIIILLAAYKKQTKYIFERIERNQQ